MDSHPAIDRPKGSPEAQAALTRVREVVACLDKTVKAFLLYPPSNPLPSEFKAELHGMLTTLLDEQGCLALSVHGDALYFGEEKVRKDVAADGFAASLTRDGIVKLRFRPGVTSEELDRFLGVVKTAVKERREGDDLATLLWEASLKGIEYEAVGGLEVIDYEAAARSRAAHRALRPGTGVSVDSAAVSGAAGGGGGGGAGDAGGAGARALAKSRQMNALVRSAGGSLPLAVLRGEAAQFDPLASTLGIIAEILGAEEDPAAFTQTCDALDDLYDRFIAQGDFASARRVCTALPGLMEAERGRAPERIRRLEESRLRTTDERRVEQLCETLNASEGRDLDACRRLLSEMPAPALPRLVAALGILERRAARDLFCDFLVERGTKDVEAVASGLTDARWFVARNVAFILGRIGGARACELLAKAIRHADERVRREAVAALARVDSDESRGQLRRALLDKSAELRLRALNALSVRRDAETGEAVVRRVSAADFARLDEEERQDWLNALARIKGDAALPLLRSFIDRSGLLLWGARRELRLQAVAALAHGIGPETTAYLQGLTEVRNKALREAAVQAQQTARLSRGRS